MRPLYLIFLLFIAACSDKSSEEHTLSAKHYLLESDINSALVELKQAVQKKNDNIEARLMLGEVYLMQGNGFSAEKEFSYLFSLGTQTDDVITGLMRSMSLLGKDEDVLEFTSSLRTDSPGLNSSIYKYRIQSLIATNNMDDAISLINQALNDYKGQNENLKSIYAYKLILNKKLPESIQVLTEIINKNPVSYESILLKGRLFLVENDFDSAIVDFKSYSDKQPADIQGSMLLLHSYLARGDIENTYNLANQLIKMLPNNPLVNRAMGIALFQQQKFSQASNYFATAVMSSENKFSNNAYLAISRYYEGEYEQALSSFNQIEKDIQLDTVIHKFFVATQLQLGETSEAYASYASSELMSDSDVILALDIGKELLKQNKVSDATDIIQKSNNVEVNLSPATLLKRGTLNLVTNSPSNSTMDIESALAADINSPYAESLLGFGYLKSKDYQKATQVADSLISQGDPQGYNIKAQVKLNEGDYEEAKNLFQLALEIDPNNFSSLLFLAEHQKNSLSAVEDYIEEFYVRYPKSAKAIKLKYNQLIKQELNDSALKLVETSFNENQDNVSIRLLLASVYVNKKLPEKVIHILQGSKVEQAAKKFNFYWQALGDSYNITNQSDKAIDVFERWLDYVSSSEVAYMKLAQSHELNNNNEKALQVIKKALIDYDASLSLKNLEVYYLIATKQFAEADQNLQTLYSKNSSDQIALDFKGRILLGQGKAKEALPLLLQTHKRMPSHINFKLAHTAMRIANDASKERTFSEQHINNHPGDYRTLEYLAGYNLKKSPERAIRYYTLLVEIKPDHFIALNNLAWLEMEAGSLKLAKEHIDQALKLKPESKNIQNTAEKIRIAISG